MSFLAPSLLIGLAAAAIPLLIHLLHRQRTQPVRWGAMQFLLEVPLKSRRRKKVENWLLLLVRTALLAVLAFLLARPLLIAGAYNPLGTGLATDVAVVLDHSLSTGRRAAAGESGGTATAFDRSLAVVDRLARAMRPNDTLSVVLAEHRPTALTPVPVSRLNVPALQRDLKQLGPGRTDASVPDAVAAARDVIAKGRNARKMVVVVSDEQRANWQIDNASAWSAAVGERTSGADRNVKLYAVPAPVDADAPDLAVSDLRITPGVVGVDRSAQITAAVTNVGAKDAPPCRVTLTIGGKATGGQDVAPLPPGKSQTVQFDHTFTQPGSQWLKVQIDPAAADALPIDNEAVAAVNVWERLPVLVIDGSFTDAGGFPGSQFLRIAMQPVEESQDARALVQPKVIGLRDSETAKFDDYPVVVVNDVPQLPPAALDRLAAYARSGGAVWLILGPRTDKQFVAQDLARAGLFTADMKELKQVKPDEAAPTVEVKDANNPMVALIADAQRNALVGADTRQWWSLRPTDDDRAVVLTAAGDPLVLERPVGRNGGRVVVWATSADRKWNNWPTMPNFVPLVNETLYHLAAARTGGQENRRLEAGEPIKWTGPARPMLQRAEVTRPDDTKYQVVPTISNGRPVVRYGDTAAPGLYALRFTPTDLPQPVYFGVGLDRRELDPATLSQADFQWLHGRGYLDPAARLSIDQLGSAVGAPNTGSELWPYLSVALLGLLAFETFMTWRMVRHQNADAMIQGPTPQPSATAPSVV